MESKNTNTWPSRYDITTLRRRGCHYQKIVSSFLSVSIIYVERPILLCSSMLSERDARKRHQAKTQRRFKRTKQTTVITQTNQH